MGLWGDTSDNIPGGPSIGEKTAMKLIGQYGSIENLLAHTSELKGKLKETLETHREAAVLSKRLATINCQTPCDLELESLRIQKPNDEQVKALCVEFEFNTIGKRLFGDDFRAGRGYGAPAKAGKTAEGTEVTETIVVEAAVPSAPLKSLADIPHSYRTVSSPTERKELIRQLENSGSFAFRLVTTDEDPKIGWPLGLAISTTSLQGFFVPLPEEDATTTALLQEFRAVLENEKIGKVGHALKSD